MTLCAPVSVYYSLSKYFSYILSVLFTLTFFQSFVNDQSGQQDLNLRPHGPQPCALPSYAIPREQLVFYQILQKKSTVFSENRYFFNNVKEEREVSSVSRASRSICCRGTKPFILSRGKTPILHPHTIQLSRRISKSIKMRFYSVKSRLFSLHIPIS